MKSSNRVKKKHQKDISRKDYSQGKLFIIIYSLIILVAFFKIYPYVFDEKIDLNGDNIYYYLLGTSIANGDGFSDIKVPSKPPSNRFPPGYPAIISMVMETISNDIPTIKRANGFFLLASVLLMFFLFRNLLKNDHLAFSLSMLLLVNASLLKYSTIMMSEMSFMFFTILSIFFLIQIDPEKPFYKNIFFYAMLVAAVFSYHIRSTGIALMVGIGFVFLIQKNWKYLAGFISGFVILSIPWYFRGKFIGLGNTGGYLDVLTYINPYRQELGTMDIEDWFTRIYKNFERYITHEIPKGTLSFLERDYKDAVSISEWIIGVVIVAFILYGLFKLPKHKFIILGYLGGSFGIMMLWPDVWFGPRFLLPVIPFLILLLGNGLYDLLVLLLNKINLRNRFVIQLALPLSFLFFTSFYTPEMEKMNEISSASYAPAYKNYFELAMWANQNTPDSTFISCRKPGLFFVYSLRYSTGYKQSENTEEILEDFIERGVDYVVVEQLGYSSTGRYLYPAIKKYPLKFKIVHHLKEPDTYLLEFRPSLGYNGAWENDERNGFGTYTWEDGKIFEGNWKDGKRHGPGKLTLTSGMTYIGEWKDDKRNGKFTIESEDGKVIREVTYDNNKLVQ